MKFELTTPTVGNFNIGDFIIGMESNCLAMIVPYYWNEIYLPKATDIDLGYETYLANKKLSPTKGCVAIKKKDFLKILPMIRKKTKIIIS